ncbi:MAG: MaoC family dehydratase [Candidatus Hydrogenedentes bacterium]|nr:MaoC family dehydratase [Candidatus Hydrogenedentota bacterium]
MPPREVQYADMKSLVGTEIGESDWYEVTQEEINAFAKATHDEQWIHVDVERAKKESPFGGPIAHGYYTLSLVPYLMDQIWTVKGISAALNYGLNRLRFPAPVLIGSKIRLRAKLSSADDVPGGVQVVMLLAMEVEGGDKPVCVAEGVFRYYE